MAIIKRRSDFAMQYRVCEKPASIRSRGRIPWLLEARTYPWGRRYPPVVLRYEVRAHEYADWAIDQLVDGLERGDGAPVLLGAERI